ncbi:thiamine diphosphokinase [Roseburia sp. MSJ-14]|uniref:thiamine diphosphokinase n=1 Tax=Roseburia sp. MSJ-14 TaxID=2841514 RepID=UPI00095CC355|nr:thiamine diphosphokinase [Roseburia sp. MSJ-14]MBU5473922.1 thiamine diphosphokinase [Roseburia sp. MSJ-14]OLA90942.1 MAG: thiamine diphosphokinase [Roseburia sp. 40_7]
MQALIVTGGSIEDTFALKFLKENPCDLTIAADSGMEFFYRNGLVPDEIVGDFDSVKSGVLEFFKENNPNIKIRKFQPEKDETDTELAIRTAIDADCKKIWLLGATGTRIDHVLGNIHLLGMAMERDCECIMLDSCNRIRMLNQGMTIRREEQYGDYISLFPFTPTVKGLTLRGFKYPLEKYELQCYHSLGVSNEISEEKAEISFEEGILLMVESKDKK